jgi:hypothetical protein
MKWIALIPWVTLLCQCGTFSSRTPQIPGPASQVSRAETIQIAQAYRDVRWKARAANIRHGVDRQGRLVHTPDSTLAAHLGLGGWWRPDETHTAMPYQWGGFDTPQSFIEKIQRGYAAGDVSSAQKRRLGDSAVSSEAAGVDCSGFISRCWRLPRSYSTAELPQISDRIGWEELLPGDILLNDQHVVLFAAWHRELDAILAYEAGSFPDWKVSSHHVPTAYLLECGFQPRRYRKITENR